MKLAEATYLAEALQEWNGWRCVSVDLYGHPVEDEQAYKVHMVKHPGMFSDLTDPDIETAYTRLRAIEAGQTYPDMRPWFYGFLDAFNRQQIRVFIFPAGSRKQRIVEDDTGTQLRVIGYEQNAIGGVDIGVESQSDDGKE